MIIMGLLALLKRRGSSAQKKASAQTVPAHGAFHGDRSGSGTRYAKEAWLYRHGGLIGCDVDTDIGADLRLTAIPPPVKRRRPMTEKMRSARLLNPLHFHGDLSLVHGPGGVVTITHQPHGEDDDAAAADAAETGQDLAMEADAVGDTNPNEPSYGAGDTGSTTELGFWDQNGGEDPFALLEYEPVGRAPYDHIETGMVDEMLKVTDEEDFDLPSRVPNQRNYQATFGLDDRMYSGFGPAAIIGVEDDLAMIVGCEIGCGLQTGVKG